MTTTQTQITASSLERHARKCKICKHKDREDIELDFLHWQSCYGISVEYELRDESAIYRHAHATGLFERRMLNIRFAAAHIVDHAESITPTAAAVLKAIQACSQINERGQWIEIPRRIIHQVEHHHLQSPDRLAANALAAAPETSEPTDISNRNWIGLENAASSTKH